MLLWYQLNLPIRFSSLVMVSFFYLATFWYVGCFSLHVLQLLCCTGLTWFKLFLYFTFYLPWLRNIFCLSIHLSLLVLIRPMLSYLLSMVQVFWWICICTFPIFLCVSSYTCIRLCISSRYPFLPIWRYYLLRGLLDQSFAIILTLPWNSLVTSWNLQLRLH